MAIATATKKIDLLINEALKTPQGRKVISDRLRKTLGKPKKGIA